ncbi:hypothetical protein CXF85_00845 [Colwellia sp. 75C3]|uniref:hypothetical protein n=1 Tax=Colwellia sp. 75C3 TaxID=888425 RepID=UPI000C32F819|nr:hypothetical protein [Colwellia sp. 75C3]PKG86289.1 hypothetical protein CXF85_00845 [Colwellia sp. 75C3]
MSIISLINQKSFNKTSLYCQIKDHIISMSPESGEGFSDVLVLKDEYRIELRFEWFDMEGYCAEKKYTITVDGDQFEITTSKLAWIIWCESVEKIESIKLKRQVFEVLLIMFAYLTKSNIESITMDFFTDFLEVVMTHSSGEVGISKRLGIRGVGVFYTFSPKKINQCCRKLALKPLISGFTKKITYRELNKVTMSVADMSYADYKEGGSFNFLSLDIGKHYINYLNDSFNDAYYSAYAVAQVEKRTTDVLCGRVESKINLTLIRFALMGNHEGVLPSSVLNNKNAYKEIKPKVKKLYEMFYKEALRKFAIFNESSLEIMIEKLGINSCDDNKLFIKSLLAIELSNSDITQAEIIEDYTSTLGYKSGNPQVTLKKFLAEKDALTNLIVKNTPVVAPDPNISKISKYSTAVGRYGFTQIMALLGWRESEYTFPNSAIHLFRNDDVVDQSRYPIRFNIKWKVPKTGGETKIHREITLTSYILLRMIQELHCSNDEQPMLYKSEGNMSNIFNIASKANIACLFGWKQFVDCYTPFKDLDEMGLLKESCSKSVLSEYEKERLIHLSELYKPSAKTQQLLEVRNKVKNDLKILMSSGVFEFNVKKQGASLINSYVNKTMTMDYYNIWVDRLSHEQKEYMASISLDQKLDRGSVNDVINTIKSGCAYPTPHAFRHMWAECVYRRYSGDVGWLIRTNFKHFGEQFYRRYLREKHMQTSEEVAKRRVVSSILSSHLESMKHDENREFAGKMDVFLRRVLKQTKAISPDEIGATLKEFAHLEIADIKANPWGYCMLKNRNQKRANCAVDGIPQRENAGIEFCIGCTNHLVEQEHVAFIILNVSNHVTTLKQPLPMIFKMESQRIVKETIKTLKQLDKNSNTSRNEKYIEEMQVAIDMADKLEV